jgi:HD superfamily phosphohydrolase
MPQRAKPEPSTTASDDAGAVDAQLPLGEVKQASLLPDDTQPADDDRRQEIFIPIHGQVRLSLHELKVLDHPAVQRLRLIYQLGQTNYVYPGATHRRFEHILGTLHVATLMIEALGKGGSTPPPVPDQGEWVLDEPLTPSERTFIRLGALLHDIGHLPAGHTLEDELGLLPRHDSEARLKQVLDRTEWFGIKTKSLRSVVDELYASAARDSQLGKSATEIVLDLVAADRVPAIELAVSAVFRTNVCRDLIGNTLCADILDYLHRDWHHLGKPRHFDTRVLEYIQIRRRLVTQSENTRKRSLLVVNLRSRDAVRTDAVTSILDLLESRYQLHEIALFHRTKLSAAAMLERVVGELADAVPSVERDEWLAQLVTDLLEASDEQMIQLLSARTDAIVDRTGGSMATQRARAARSLLTGLRLRRLHKRLHVQFAHQLGNDAPAILKLYAPRGNDRRPAEHRLQALRLLESDFGLRPGTLVMYCPPAQMSTKIANVEVLVDGVANALDAHEREQPMDRGLTGGYLEAQKNRFKRLWRVHFAMEAQALTNARATGMHSTLIRAIECLILGRRPGDATLEEMARSVAVELSALRKGPLAEATIVTGSVAARGSTAEIYPVGVPSLRAFVR